MKKKEIVKVIEHSRLDAWLQDYTKETRSCIKEWIKTGLVLVNNQAVKPAYRVQIGDEIVFPEFAIKKEIHTKTKHVLATYMYEDADIVVVNKPAGLLVHQGDIQGEYCLVDQLKEDKIHLYQSGATSRPGIVHRLDRMTDGVMVVAKSKIAFESLTEQFKHRDIEKVYVAMLKGNVVNDYFIVDKPILRHSKIRNKYKINDGGKDAYTEFEVMKRYNSMTLCKVLIKTGRTHQIRVHANFMGHPIVGDQLYGQSKTAGGQRLQAIKLAFNHPRLLKRMVFNLSMSARLRGVK